MLAPEKEERLLARALQKGLLSEPMQHADTVKIEPRTDQIAWGNRLDPLIADGRIDIETIEILLKELEDSDQQRGSSRKDTLSFTVQDTVHQNLNVNVKARISSRVFPIVNWDRYEPIRFVGEGGMGKVFLARDKKLNRMVALKFIRSENQDSLDRFTQEAQVQARIEHENICRVYEVGEVEDHPYIAMQFIDGPSLKEAREQLTIEQKVKIIKEVSEGLHAAHRLGLVHRDIKPANIMLERNEESGWRPYVMDFGLARDTGAEAQTQTGIIIGTPAYMSPEQARGLNGKMDRRSDVYCLGATLYELLAGKPPFRGQNGMEIMLKVIHEEPQTLRSIDNSIPADLEAIALKCLEKEPQRRYQTAKQLAEDLQCYLDGEPIEARKAGIAYKLSKKARRHRVILAISSLALVSVIILGIMLVRARISAAEQAAVAQQFGQEIKEIEGIMRYACMLPLHNTQQEKQLVKEKMTQIEARIKQVGTSGSAIGHYALGRGYLALRQYDEARQHLEIAQRDGLRSPQVTFSYGLILGELYRRELEKAKLIGNLESRESRLVELAKLYRDPAINNLKAGSSDAIAPAYVEGLMALYERRYHDTLIKADEAARQISWLYEAQILKGDAYRLRAQDEHILGKSDQARADLEQARAAYQIAIGMARSSSIAYERDAQRLLMLLTLFGKQAADESLFQQALAQADQAIIADPDSSEAFAIKAAIYFRWGEQQLAYGQQPRGFSQAIEMAEQALKRDANNSAAYNSMGLASYHLAQYQIWRGQSPDQLFEQAIQSFNNAIDIEPAFTLPYVNLGRLYWRMGMYQLARGIDPRDALNRSIENNNRAIQLEPKAVDAINALGNAYEIIGEYEVSRGLDPEKSLKQAIDNYQHLIDLNPKTPYGYTNIGITYKTRARFEILTGRDPRPSLAASSQFFQKVLVFEPFPEPMKWLGETYLKQARYELEQGLDHKEALTAAAKTLNDAVKLNNSDFETYLRLGELELLTARAQVKDRGTASINFSRALSNFNRALELNNQHAELYRLMAECYLYQAMINSGAAANREINQGLAACEKAIALNPQQAESLIVQGRLQLLQASRNNAASAEIALSSFNKAIEINPLQEPNCRPWLAEARKLVKN